jgi:hypothetical protein
MADHAGGHVRQLLVAEQDAFRGASGAASAQEDPAARHLRGSAIKRIYPERAVGDCDSGTRYRQDAGHVGVRRSGVERDRDPPGADDRQQGGRVLKWLGQPDRDPGARRESGVVEAPLPVEDGLMKAGVGQPPGAAGVLEVRGTASTGCRLLDPHPYHCECPSAQYIIRGSL